MRRRMVRRVGGMVAAVLCAGALAAAAGGAPPGGDRDARGTWNPLRPGPDNQPLPVRVLVLNYDPRVPSEGNRRLSEVFRWNDSRRLAAGYREAMEFSSGGYLRFEVVEWRDLDEIYAQKDGFRYTIEEYVRNRRAGSGWRENAEADYPRLLREQNVPAMVDAGDVDEVWIFSDHFFGLWEASMAGPGSFFINGGVYPEVETGRPFAFFGFNYERGVAEMVHNTSHRTESTLNRIYGGWNLPNPVSNWDRFSANDRQSGGAAGVGTCHWPPNAERDYNYDNPRVVQSWAGDFLNYPDLTGEKKPVSRDTWSPNGGDYHLDYMRWYFAHLPRASGTNPDGRQNNWWKYVYDFGNYTEEGKPLPPRAALLPAKPGSAVTEIRVAYRSPYPLAAESLDDRDLEVTVSGGAPVRAIPVPLPDRGARTDRVVTYHLTPPIPPGASWKASLRAGEVRDALGREFR
jgi:hypothetical protein